MSPLLLQVPVQNHNLVHMRTHEQINVKENIRTWKLQVLPIVRPTMATRRPRRSITRLADYEDLAKELILQAATVYHCLLSTEDAFPDLATEAEMVKTAWGWVNRETGLTPLRLTPDIAKI